MTDTTTPTGDVFKGLPRRIQIGPHTFRIVVTNQAANTDLVDNHGMSYLTEFRIALDESMPVQQAALIVQHEVTHCINWVYGVDDDSSEEHATTQHSKGLIEVQLRNPRFHNWMVKTIRRMRKEASHD